MMAKKVKNRNPVAKFSRRFNKAVTMTDRKKEQKKTGRTKGRNYCVDEDFYDSAGGFEE